MLKDNEVAIGRITRPFGIKGDVKLVCMTDFPQRFDVGNSIDIRIDAGTVRTLQIVRSVQSGDFFTLHFKGVEDRNSSEELAGCFAFVTEDRLMVPEDGAEYVFRLIGMQVVTTDGRNLGAITDVLQGGANDVYVVEEKLCIPVIPQCVLNIDKDKRVVTIFPMKGLIPDAF